MSVIPSVFLSYLPMSWRLLITGFLLFLGAGYLAGGLNASLSVRITPASIADYYGDNSLIQEEASAISEQGFVEEDSLFDDEPETSMEGHDMTGLEHTSHGGDAPQSITAQQMAGMAHVPLLGFAMILLSIGSLACVSTLSEGTKASMVVL